MYWDFLSVDVSGVHCLMNSHTLNEVNNMSSVDYTKKRYRNFPNVSEMGDDLLHDGIDVDAVLSTFILHQYSKMEFNNELHSPLVIGTISPSYQS